MTDKKYYFERDAESLAVGEIIDGLSRYHKKIFSKLHVEGESSEEIAEKLNLDPETIEEIECQIFEHLKQLISLELGKEFGADDTLSDVERDYVINAFRNEIYFREDRANYMRTRDLSHVP